MKQKRRVFPKWLLCFMAALMMLLGMTSCLKDKGDKVRDLDALILSEEVLPAELKEIIDGKKAQAFQFTYSDKEKLYICIGYGRQETGGYSIALDELYLTDSEVVVGTTLLGPSVTDRTTKKTATYPYIVIQTELVEQPVVFE